MTKWVFVLFSGLTLLSAWLTAQQVGVQGSGVERHSIRAHSAGHPIILGK